jgi:tetratricopeptide (TPR) repeat protein
MLVDLNEALAASREWGDFKTMVECQFEAGFLHLWRGEFEEAEEGLGQALELTETSGIVPLQTLSLTYLTVLYRFRDQMETVLKYALRSQELAETAHMPDYVAAAEGNQAWLAWRRGDYDTAEQRGQEALKIWHHSPLVYPFQWQALWPLMGVALKQGEEDAVWDHLRALLDHFQQQMPDGLNDLLEAALLAKDRQQARVGRQYLERAMEIAQHMGYL